MNDGRALPPWLLLPGHLCTAAMWEGVRDTLTVNDRQVAVADLATDCSVNAMARRTIATLTRRTILVGFSMGGIVALRVHALASELLAGLVLISSNARPDMPERSATRLDHQRRARSGQLATIVASEMVPAYFSDGHPDHAELQLAAIGMAEELGPDVFVRQSEAIRTRPDSRLELARIQCPVLIVGGRQDTLSPPAWQHELAAGIRCSELVIIERAGHFVPLEAGVELAAALRSWSDRHAF